MALPRATVARLILFLVNLIFFVFKTSLILFGAGKVATVSSQEHHQTFMGVSWKFIGIAFIVVGVIGVVVSLIGLLNVFFESQCLHISYVTFVAMTVATVLGFVITNALFRDPILQKSKTYFTKLMATQDPAVHLLQSTAHCCGALSAADWHNHALFANTSFLFAGRNYPASCCTSQANNKYVNHSLLCSDPNLVHRTGCFSAVQIAWYQSYGNFLVAFFMAGLLLMIALACFLERDRKLNEERQRNLEYVEHLKLCHGEAQSSQIDGVESVWI